MRLTALGTYSAISARVRFKPSRQTILDAIGPGDGIGRRVAVAVDARHHQHGRLLFATRFDNDGEGVILVLMATGD
jgi:hypothetical protein